MPYRSFSASVLSRTVESLRCANPFWMARNFISALLIIPQTRAGIMKTEDARVDLLSPNPELCKHVPSYDTYLKTRCCPRRAICAATFVGSELLTDFKDQSIGLSSSGAIHPGKFCVRARMTGASILKRLTGRTIGEQRAAYAIRWWLERIIRITSNDWADCLNPLLLIIVENSTDPNDPSAQHRIFVKLRHFVNFSSPLLLLSECIGFRCGRTLDVGNISKAYSVD